MIQSNFYTQSGTPIPVVTEDQMREIDRIAMEDFGLGVLQMMENAGRNLALNVIDMVGAPTGKVAILAGVGGNGGGGICCARHLHNRGFQVLLVLTKDANAYRGSAGHQLNILQAAGLHPVSEGLAETVVREADLVVDAIIGYSLKGAPRGRSAELIEICNQHAREALSLDIPSGVNATTGETPGLFVRPTRTLTLALPKTGLLHVPGDLYLADIGIPPEVYHPLGIHFEPFFGGRYWIRMYNFSGLTQLG
ncbi:MAG: NAD(P)H-hydrate epimerase, partial [Anaerolineales bacterium]